MVGVYGNFRLKRDAVSDQGGGPPIEQLGESGVSADRQPVTLRLVRDLDAADVRIRSNADNAVSVEVQPALPAD